MENMKEKIEIAVDLEVHKQIEAGRRQFEESPNDILRRLLGIDTEVSLLNQGVKSDRRAWSGRGGVVLPHGTELRMPYKGVIYEGKIENQKWLVEGRSFDSPSAAACYIARDVAQVVGEGTNVNGWYHWEAKRPGDTDWVLIDELRQS